MDLVNDIIEYHKNFKGQPKMDFAAEHTELPVFAVTMYLAFVFLVPTWLANRKPFKFPLLFPVWNICLAVFSIFGASVMVPVLARNLWNNGLRYTVCANPDEWYANGPAAVWVWLFIFSKFPELFDTFFLVMQKKNVIFLHWFHHTTVLLYCWHAFVMKVAPGIWFATMNFCVHSTMYTYYFLMGIRSARKVTRTIAPLVTTLQLLQMVMGATVTAMSAYYHLLEGKAGCHVDPANYKLGLAMYSAYFVLFAVLFRDHYCRGAKEDLGVCHTAMRETDAAGRFLGRDQKKEK